MSSPFRYKKLKELRFRKPDSEVLPLDVPRDINQEVLSQAIRDEYLVLTVAAGRSIAESEVCTIRSANSTVGYLIPGQAILSPDQQLNSEKMYGTYSLLAAMEVCERSFRGDYELSPYSLGSDSPKTVFHEGIFYLVVWLKKLGCSATTFADDYFVSLAKHGLVLSSWGRKPFPSQRMRATYDQPIRISKNSTWPGYVRTIISELEPYAADPFLRFFYLYQVIETLMSGNYKSELDQIRVSFDAKRDLSITQLREYVEKFQRIYREKTRINNVLQPPCPRSMGSAEALLIALSEFEPEDSFGEMIYKVRNIIFHDYQRAHPYASLVSDLEEDLTSYILEKKLA